ncbi:MAG: RimJ/RimL family protein N-acetyltransferase [Myxococcota bacterium]|jgi:RimJ/RimL family protein N-acetyltransferase
MKSDLHLAVERDPDFFALYDIQDVDCVPWVLEADGRVEGCATVLARDGFVDGKRQRVGYAGDLRFTDAVRGRGLLTNVYGPALAEAMETLGCDLVYTALITTNKAAIRALTERQDHDDSVPVYTRFASYRITNIQYTTRKRLRPTALTVRTATDADLPMIAARLSQDHAGRAFGYVVTEDLLRQRFARWPDFGIESFYLALDGDRLVGVCAPWDAHALKRYRVLGYHGAMRWIRAGFNIGATLGGFERLPPAGGLLRYFYLTHVSADDAAAMSALVDRIYADFYGRGYHFFCACVVDDDPLGPAYTRFRTTDLPAALYTVSLPGVPVPIEALRSATPGFEMALV